MSDLTETDLKAAEKRGCARGYQAGRRRVAHEDARLDRERRKEDFRRQAFLAALPSCIQAQGWQDGGKPISSMVERTRLAWSFAGEAVKGAWFA